MSTPEEPPKIRLPELPIFQKYSIALRQEFADAAEFESILEKTLKRVRGTVPTRSAADAAPAAPAVDAATQAPRAPAVDAAPQAPRTDNSPTYVPPDPARLVESPAPSASTAPSDQRETQTKTENETKVDPEEASFWEMDSPDAPRPPRKARAKRKAKPPGVVRVSSSGTPIVESSSKK